MQSTMRGESNDESKGRPDNRNHLRSTVEAALARSTFLAGKSLRFEVHEDGVVLRGVVGSYYQKQLVQESLKSISGVRKIQNEIEVVS
jgi:osmotically-inducible protein OsmY